MSRSLPFAAVASPDGSGWGLAIGSARALDPDLGPEPVAGLEALLPAAGAELTAVALGESPAITGSVPETREGDSVRLAVALFSHGRAFALSALRPRRARGHDRDVTEAIVSEEGDARPVEDPRLSVTLDGAGAPQRVGLELWLAPAEEEAYDFPRRAAGEVIAPGVELDTGELTGTAHRVRWRSRGEEGGGWFVLLHGR